MSADTYLPEDPDYTLVDSVRDSVRFAHFCLEHGNHGRWASRSGAVDRDGRPVPGHPLAGLEGPGGDANALGGGLTLYRWARFDQNPILEKVAIGILDHVLSAGYVVSGSPLRPFRDTATGELHLNWQREEGWYAPADQARIGLQALKWSVALPARDPRQEPLKDLATEIGRSEAAAVAVGPGSLPQKRYASGRVEGEAGAESLYAAWLLMDLEEAEAPGGLESARLLLDAFVRRGGVFRWNSGDEPDTTRGRALAIRVLRRAAERFRDPSYGEFAIEEVLPPLEERVLRSDMGGLPVTGLVTSSADSRRVLMADAAECSLSCQEASEATGDREHLCAGVTMLRAVARVHRIQAEPHGFLAMGLDLDPPSSAGDIRPDTWTSPLYANLLHVDAALHFLSRRIA